MTHPTTTLPPRDEPHLARIPRRPRWGTPVSRGRASPAQAPPPPQPDLASWPAPPWCSHRRARPPGRRYPAGPQGPPGSGKGPAGPQGTPASTPRTARTASPSRSLPRLPPRRGGSGSGRGQRPGSDGEYKVGTDIQPGEYAGKVEDPRASSAAAMGVAAGAAATTSASTSGKALRRPVSCGATSTSSR